MKIKLVWKKFSLKLVVKSTKIKVLVKGGDPHHNRMAKLTVIYMRWMNLFNMLGLCYLCTHVMLACNVGTVVLPEILENKIKLEWIDHVVTTCSNRL